MTTVRELLSSSLQTYIDAQRTSARVLITPVYNVVGFGATGDGATDDTSAIQSAIDAAVAAGEKIVYFPKGTYKVTALTSIGSVIFCGDNASFSGITTRIGQLGEFDSSFNVKTYGAVGDGVTDDTTAIAAAITAAGGRGGRVIFPRGVYLISSTLSVNTNGLILEGIGGDVDGTQSGMTTIKWGGATGGTMLKFLKTFNGGIYHLRLDGAGTAATGIWLLASGGAQNNTWDHVYIKGCTGKCLRLADDATASTINELHAYALRIDGSGSTSTGIYFDQNASENINFYALELASHGTRHIHVQAGHMQIYGLLTDGGPAADYCIYTNVPIRIHGWLAEEAMAIHFAASGQNRGSIIEGCDFRSINPTAGEGAIRWQASGAFGGTLTLIGVRIKAAAGYTVDPNIIVAGGGANTCVYAIGVGWDSTTPGSFTLSGANARLVALEEDGDIYAANVAGAPKLQLVGSSGDTDAQVDETGLKAHSATAGLHLGSASGAVDTEMTRTAANVLTMSAGDSFGMDGTWNGGTLRLGAYYLWVDTTGDLRIKSGAPTGDTDGTIVGTQT